MISLQVAIKLMREGQTCTRLHTHNGVRWFITNSGEITAETAAQIVARADVQPLDAGLLPDCPQSFCLRPEGSILCESAG